MVGAYGMGDELISYMGSATPGSIIDKVLGSEDARKEVSRILKEAKALAVSVLARTRTCSKPCATPSSSSTNWSARRSPR